MKALWTNQTKWILFATSAAVGLSPFVLRGAKRFVLPLDLLGAAGIGAALLMPTKEEEEAAKNAIPVLAPNPQAATAFQASRPQDPRAANAFRVATPAAQPNTVNVHEY